MRAIHHQSRSSLEANRTTTPILYQKSSWRWSVHLRWDHRTNCRRTRNYGPVSREWCFPRSSDGCHTHWRRCRDRTTRRRAAKSHSIANKPIADRLLVRSYLSQLGWRSVGGRFDRKPKGERRGLSLEHPTLIQCWGKWQIEESEWASCHHVPWCPWVAYRKDQAQTGL